jgi:hypothetical protein
MLRYHPDVRQAQVSSSGTLGDPGAALTLTPEQEWLFAASELIRQDRGSIHPAPNCDEQQLRMLIDATAAGLVCTFCAATKPSWRYPAVKVDIFPGAFVLPGQHLSLPQTEWLACDVCADLIVRGDRDALARRSTEHHFNTPTRYPNLWDAVEGAVRYIQDEFWRSRCGAREGVPSFHTQV